MKRSKQLFGLILFFLLCQCLPKSEEAEEAIIATLLEQTMKAHGGQSLWDSIQYLAYTKEIKLYKEDGSLEKEVIQLHTNDFGAGITQMDWEEDEWTYQATLANNKLRLTQNGKAVTDSTRLKSVHNSLDGALYVFWQPRKLLDERAQIEFRGERTLFNSKEVFEVMVEYPEEKNGDQWFYFIDKESLRLAATGVIHQGRISLITNDEVEEETGLFLNKKRSSYFTDEEFKPLYLRASYRYRVDEIRKEGQAAAQGYLRAEQLSDKQRGAHVFRLRDTSRLKPFEQMNIEWVTLVPWGFQEVVGSGEITHHWNEEGKKRRDSAWVARIGQIRARGLKVFLKPHVWLDHTEQGEWRQDIFPENSDTWEIWKKQYADFILRYARIAELSGAEMFCVGTEFSRLSVEFPFYWKRLIRQIREVYSGKLTYAANWHKEYESISFWSELDYVGVQAYFPLVKKEKPSTEEIAQGWNRFLPSLESVSEEFKKPLLFTEMGYRSVPNAAMRPWEWIEDTGYSGLYSPETQANSYRAFFDKVWPEPWFAGVHIWQLRADYVDKKENDLDFTPQFKPASREITYGFLRKREELCAARPKD